MATGREGTLVPARLLIPYVLRWCERKGACEKAGQPDCTHALLREHLGIGPHKGRALHDPNAMVSFLLADEIICWVAHPMVWQIDPALRAVYQNLDLAWLDAKQPVTQA